MRTLRCTRGSCSEGTPCGSSPRRRGCPSARRIMSRGSGAPSASTRSSPAASRRACRPSAPSALAATPPSCTATVPRAVAATPARQPRKPPRPRAPPTAATAWVSPWPRGDAPELAARSWPSWSRRSVLSSRGLSLGWTRLGPRPGVGTTRSPSGTERASRERRPQTQMNSTVHTVMFTLELAPLLPALRVDHSHGHKAVACNSSACEPLHSCRCGPLCGACLDPRVSPCTVVGAGRSAERASIPV
mmetsp:Transcript_4907/g.16179  ORF Transcript_4907/g.16179 Transcript_4907/m.16179 type:complete len:246 (+) Transcript_4907:1624-2361(+)